MRQNSFDTIDVTRTDYDPKISRNPELIGKHPGTIAPVMQYRPSPLQFVKPERPRG